MGAPMAERLLSAGHQLTVWNRSPEKLIRLAELGALAADSPAEAAKGADVIILMLDTADRTCRLLFDSGVADALQPAALVIDMSSNTPETARGCAERLESSGIHHLDAPVSGGTVGARNGTLAIMVGGTDANFARAQSLFASLGKATHVGPSGTGQLAKLANQIIVAITIGAVSEALLFAKMGAADPAAVRDALSGGFADSLILQLHGDRMIKRMFQPGGTVGNQIKDLDAAQHVAAAHGLKLPLLNAVNSAFQELATGGNTHLDHSSLYLWLERVNEAVVEPNSLGTEHG
ncbi:2-hydroxy-3-oxopropionate reductase [Ensifer sp. YR511]|nr:2-hydroxy-3-oxopropionate reductase [Ensifer sp. YR511]